MKIENILEVTKDLDDTTTVMVSNLILEETTIKESKEIELFDSGKSIAITLSYDGKSRVTLKDIRSTTETLNVFFQDEDDSSNIEFDDIIIIDSIVILVAA
jgi:hypothetical protein